MERVVEVLASSPGTVESAETGLQASALALLLDQWDHGVIVATPQGRIVHANQAARRELDRGQRLHGAGGELQAQDAESTRSLQDSLARAASGKRSLASVQAAGRPPLAIAVLPLQAERPGHAARIALVFARSSVCDPLMLCFFARSHGLTHTEEQVLGILCQGYSAPEAARQLNVAVSTVRSHVRNLCAKTRCNGVREVVSRVAVLPPVAPIWHEAVH